MLQVMEVFILISVILMAVGAVLGSFLNVLIYRTLDEEPLRRHESWMRGWSRCDECKKRIAWYDNIPLVSYVLLRGRCRYCKKKITLSHPVVELLVGTLFVWWYWSGAFFFQLTQAPLQMLQPLFWLMVGILLLVIAIADVRYWIIPDWAVGMLTFITLLYRIVLVTEGVMRPVDLLTTLTVSLASVVALWTLWLLTKKKGIGLGDVKLVFPLGLLLGWPNTLVGLFLAFVMGAGVGVTLVLLKRRHVSEALPFGPFLVAASCVSLLWGDALVRWYTSLLK